MSTNKAARPRIPFPYYAEAWTGIEYLVAAQFIHAGMVREGVETVEDVRRRHDGERRNPWDEPECGHHYARAMSAWAPLLALSGYLYSAVFAPDDSEVLTAGKDGVARIWDIGAGRLIAIDSSA